MLFIFCVWGFQFNSLELPWHLESRFPSACHLLVNKPVEARSSKQPVWFAHHFVGQTFGKGSTGAFLWSLGSRWGASVHAQGPRSLPHVPSPRGCSSSLQGRLGQAV